MYHCKNQTLRTLYKTFILERPSFPKFFERQLRFIASGIILQNCFAVKRCRQFLLTVCCVRHAFQVLRCVNNGSCQTACRLFSRLYLIVAKVVAVQISPFKPTFVITETQFTRGVPSSANACVLKILIRCAVFATLCTIWSNTITQTTVLLPRHSHF